MADGAVRRLPWTRVESPPGAGGRIDIPLIGAHVADFRSWKLVRRGAAGLSQNDETADAGLFDLHAILTWINVPLWEDVEYHKEIVIDFGRVQKCYRLDPQPGFPVVLVARSLVVEGCIPCLLEP